LHSLHGVGSRHCRNPKRLTAIRRPGPLALQLKFGRARRRERTASGGPCARPRRSSRAQRRKSKRPQLGGRQPERYGFSSSSGGAPFGWKRRIRRSARPIVPWGLEATAHRELSSLARAPRPWAGYPEEGLSTANRGRTSAPRCPQALQMNFGSRSDSRTSSGHRSALIAIEWLQ
jgi:hypothetical protein